MKSLTTLIKLHKRKVDELKRRMGALESQKAQLQETTARLKKELQDEMVLAGKQPEMGAFFGGFAKRIQKRQQDIAGEIKKIDAEMQKLQDEIAEAFGELKKFEIALQNAKQRQKEDQNRKETILLDEIASQQHRRKQSEPQ